MELTCPLEGNETKANTQKQNTYTPLEISLKEKGFKVCLMPFEIGSSGHITKHNKMGIENTLKTFRVKLKKQTLNNLSKISLLCTMSIFHAYHTSEWVDPPLLEPWLHNPYRCGLFCSQTWIFIHLSTLRTIVYTCSAICSSSFDWIKMFISLKPTYLSTYMTVVTVVTAVTVATLVSYDSSDTSDTSDTSDSSDQKIYWIVFSSFFPPLKLWHLKNSNCGKS